MTDTKADSPKKPDEPLKPASHEPAAEPKSAAVSPTEHRDALKVENARIETTTAPHLQPVTIEKQNPTEGEKAKPDAAATLKPGETKPSTEPALDQNKVNAAAERLYTSTGAQIRAEQERLKAMLSPEDQMMSSIAGAGSFDLPGSLAVLQNKSKLERTAIDTQFKVLSGTTLEATFRDNLGGADLERALSILKRTDGDLAGQRADSISADLTELSSGGSRSKDRIEEHLRDTFATSTKQQIQDMDLNYQLSHKDAQGHPVSLANAINSDKSLSAESKAALNVLLNGSDNISQDQRLQIARIGLDNHNALIFQEAMTFTTPETRALFQQNGGEQKVKDSFSGTYVATDFGGTVVYPPGVTASDLQHTLDYAKYGKLSAATEISENSGNDKVMDAAISKMTDEERRLYTIARDVAQNNPEAKNASDADRQKATDFASLYDAVKKTGKEPELSDKIMGPEGGSLISSLGAAHRKPWYWVNSSTSEIQKDLDKVSPKDLQYFQSHPERVKDLEKLFRSLGKDDQDTGKLMLAFNSKLDAKIQADKNVVEIRQQFVIDSLSKTTDEWQNAYRQNQPFRDGVNAQIDQLLGKGAATDIAHKLFDQIRCGEKPTPDLVDQLKLNTTDPAKAIKDTRDAFTANPELARKVLNPQSPDESAYAQQVRDALTASTSKPGVDGVSLALEAQKLIATTSSQGAPDTRHGAADTLAGQLNRPANEQVGAAPSELSALQRLNRQADSPNPSSQASIEAVLHMSPQDQDRFRNDLPYRQQLTDKAKQLIQSPLRESAQAMFDQIMCGEKPSLDLSGKVTLNAMLEKSPEKALRDIAGAIKDNPELRERLLHPATDADKRLAFTVQGGIMQIAAANSFSIRDDYKQLLNTGHIPLERLMSYDKAIFHSDFKQTVSDLLSAAPEDKIRIQTDKAYQDRVLSPFNEEQRKALLHIASKGEAKPEDSLMFRIAGGGTRSEIMEDLRGIKQGGLADVITQAGLKYKIDLESRVYDKLDGEQRSEAERIFAQNKTLGEQQDLARTQASETLPRHGSIGESFTSGASASLQDSLLQANKQFADYQQTMANLPQEEKQQLEDKVRKAQGILGGSIGTLITAQKDAADTITNVGIGAVGITSVFATGGASIPLLASVATVGGIAKVGTRAALMGGNYMQNQIGGDFMVGAVIGAGNVLGPGEVAGIFGLGRAAAANAVEKTFQVSAATGLRDAIADGAQAKLNRETQDLMKNALATNSGINPAAIRAAADRAISRDASDRALRVQELTASLQTNIDTQFKQETANWARNIARSQAYNMGGGVLGSGSGAAVEGAFSEQSFNDTVRGIFSASAIGALSAFGMGNALHLGGRALHGAQARVAQTEAPVLNSSQVEPAVTPQLEVAPAGPKTSPADRQGNGDAPSNVVPLRPRAQIAAPPSEVEAPPAMRRAAQLDAGDSPAQRSAGQPESNPRAGDAAANPPKASEWDLTKPQAILRDEALLRDLQARYSQFSPEKAQRLYDGIVEAQKTWKGDIPAMRNEAAVASAEAHNNYDALQRMKEDLRKQNVSAQDINAAISDKDNPLNKQGDKSLYDLYHNVISARDKREALIATIETERTARAKSLEGPLKQFSEDLGLPIRQFSFMEQSQDGVGGYINGRVELGRSLLDENVASLIGSTAHHETLHLRQDVDFIRSLIQKESAAGKTGENAYFAVSRNYEDISGKELDRQWFDQVQAYAKDRPALTEAEMAHASEVARSGNYGEDAWSDIARGSDSRNSARVISSWARRLEQDSDNSLGAMQDLARELNNSFGATLQRRLFRNNMPREFEDALRYAKSHNGEMPAEQIPALKAQLLEKLRDRFQYEDKQGALNTAVYFNSEIEREAFATTHLYPKPEKPFTGTVQPETKLRPEVQQLGNLQSGIRPGENVGVGTSEARRQPSLEPAVVVESAPQSRLEPPVVAQKPTFARTIDDKLTNPDPAKIRELKPDQIATPESQLYLLRNASIEQTASLRRDFTMSMYAPNGLFRSEAWNALSPSERVSLSTKMLDGLSKNKENALYLQRARDLQKQVKDAGDSPGLWLSNNFERAKASLRDSRQQQRNIQREILRAITPSDIAALTPDERGSARAALEKVLKENDPPKAPHSTADNARDIVNKHLGTAIDDGPATRILSAFDGQDRQLAIEIMRQRSPFLTQQGLNQEFTKMGDDLAKGNFVSTAREAGNYGRETKKITAVVFGDATEGHELAYQFRKATGFTVDIKVVKTKEDFDLAIGRGTQNKNNVVLFDAAPASNTPLGQHMRAARDQWIEPKTLADFRAGVNIHDMDGLVLDPTRLAAKLKTSVQAEKLRTTGPDQTVAPQSPVPVSQADISALRDSIETARKDTRDTLQTESLLFFAQRPSQYRNQMSDEFANNVNYTSRQQMMEDAFALHEKLVADGKKPIYVTDIDKQGSSHLITDMYKRANGLDDTDFKSVAEISAMAKRGELRGRKVVFLDDCVYTGSQINDQVLPKFAKIRDAAMSTTGGARFEIGVLNGYREGMQRVDTRAIDRNLNVGVVVGADNTYTSSAAKPATLRITAGDAYAEGESELAKRLNSPYFKSDPSKGASDVISRTVYPHKVPNNNPQDLNNLFQNYLDVAGAHVENKATGASAMRDKADAKLFKVQIKMDGYKDIPQLADAGDGVFRGGKPRSTQVLDQLEKEKKVTEIIDLNQTPSDTSKQWAAAQKGRHYLNLPMSTATVTEQQIVRAAAEINNRVQAGANVLLHCGMGRDRTSAVMAYYRVRYQGWSREAALTEMHDFGYRPTTPGNQNLDKVMRKVMDPFK